MSEEKIEELLDVIFKKKITKTGSSIGSYQTEIIDTSGRTVIEGIIRGFLMENRDNEIATLEAKVFAYEKIISNSNFAPILKPQPQNEDNE